MRLILSILIGGIINTAPMTISNASPQPDYECEGAEAATASLFPNGGLGEFIYKMGDETVGLVGYAEKSEQLQLEGAGHEGTRYSGQGLAFFESSQDGLDHALIIEATGQRITCKSTKVASNLEGAGDKGWIAGQSMESIVRDAPSVDGNRIDKLPFGEPVAILRNEGNLYQELPWFQIEYSEGIKGFVWGGTLCSEGQLVAGIASQCE